MASLTRVFILVVCLAVFHRGIDSEATTAAAVPVQETCTVSTVTEGEPAVMTFKLRSGIDTTSKKFFAHLRRNDRKLTDIMTCDGLNIACDVKDDHPMFQVDDNNIKENVLTVRISNMSRELEDTYVLQVYFNGTPEPPNSCTLNTTYTHTTPMAGDEDGSNDWIAAPIICLLLLLIIGLLLLFYRKKIMSCWRRASKACKNKADNVDGPEGDQMLGAHTNAPSQSPRPNAEEKLENSHEGKRWFVGTLGVDVDKLFEFEKNGPGSFVITQNEMDQYSFTLIVCCTEGKPRRFQISQTDDAFTVEGSSETFKTLCDLVAHFRDRGIGNSGVRLSKPYQEEPNEAWYFGRLTREEEGKLFSSKNDGTGSFAVYESVTEPDKYALSVKFGGKRCCFTIGLHDDGLKFNAGDGTYFKTLPELVEHYKKIELTYKPKVKGRLGKPCEKLLTDKEKNILSTNGPDSYFCKPCIGSSQHVLAVNVKGEVKTFPIIKNAQGHQLADVAVPFKDLSSLINHYKRNNITIHGTELCSLSEDCSHEIGST